MKISEYFNLNQNQVQLDFVDVITDDDTPLFIDPYFISRNTDEWSISATKAIRNFFQKIIENINRNPELCKYMLSNLNEPKQDLDYPKERLGEKELAKNRPTIYIINFQKVKQLLRGLFKIFQIVN